MELAESNGRFMDSFEINEKRVQALEFLRAQKNKVEEEIDRLQKYLNELDQLMMRAETAKELPRRKSG